MTKHPVTPRSEEPFNTETVEGRMEWFFHEFWPIMVWGFIFVLMIALPLSLSGLFPNPFATATTVWPVYGLLIAAYFVLAMLITFVAPGWLGVYILMLGIYCLIAAEDGAAWMQGSAIAILFLMYTVVGILIYMMSGFGSRRLQK